MRISDWSSDVCSSDLIGGGHTLTSISAWRGFETVDGLDSDSSTDNFLDINYGDHKQRQVSQELRSEEHTSELQSLMRISYAVFCLKKKTPYNDRRYIHQFTRVP